MADEASTSLSEINAYLRAELPLTAAMGIEVRSWDGRIVRLGAPLGPNLNHSDTAFGGSIAALGILAGYTLIYLALRDRNISNRLLIQRSEVDFLRPIDGDLVATAVLPDAAELETFIDAIRRKRRGRLTVVSEIGSGAGVGARHVGAYIAILY
jgi:thioesterase domain-containing protein